MFISSSIQQTFNEVKCLCMTYAPGMGLDSRGRAEKKANSHLLREGCFPVGRESTQTADVGYTLGQGGRVMRRLLFGVRVQGDLSKLGGNRTE